MIAAVTGLLGLAGCSAGGAPAAGKTSAAAPAGSSARTTRYMSAKHACQTLNATQAQYGMSGAQGRATLRLVVANLASTGMSGRIKRAAAEELAHPPVHNESQYNADWVNDCILVAQAP